MWKRASGAGFAGLPHPGQCLDDGQRRQQRPLDQPERNLRGLILDRTNLVAGQSDANGVVAACLYESDPGEPAADFDGDGDSDVSVFRPLNSPWYVQGGSTSTWGTTADIPVLGDYDGDGDTDVAVFRPSNGFWFVQGGVTTQFGTNGDIPLPLPDAVRRFFFPPL